MGFGVNLSIKRRSLFFSPDFLLCCSSASRDFGLHATETGDFFFSRWRRRRADLGVLRGREVSYSRTFFLPDPFLPSLISVNNGDGSRSVDFAGCREGTKGIGVGSGQHRLFGGGGSFWEAETGILVPATTALLDQSLLRISDRLR
ncbi:uncharacterized protein LOC122035305 [Zingiber officinale]|uniref:uncharacterized protein LOC122035305 n=1 Tax=Zingiber officinale TaxID=94328 RepID=UPI001C4BCA35|nr:uncharacterized protein LOC122035305 [Zingiber officinale]